MDRYEHRQPLARWASVMMAAVAALLLYLAIVFPNAGTAPWPVEIAFVMLLATWAIVSVLITRVDARGVAWSFAWGWPSGRIPFSRIARVERSELNLAERGTAGIHWTIWHGWLWNVAGAQAIEIFTTDGRRTTLGTDDPEGLLKAIERFAMGAA